MREVRVKVPHGQAEAVVELAMGVGIREASVHREFSRGPDRWVDIVSVDTSTPLAAAFAEAVQASPCFAPDECTLTIRELRALVTDEAPEKITRPLPRPRGDVGQELEQFTQVTLGHVGRVLIAAGLLAYGMIANRLLTMIAGLLFLPTLPQLMAIAHGARSRNVGLARRGTLAISASLLLIAVGGALVALVAREPLGFSDFPSPFVGASISTVVGVAAALATVDDVGRRELIGLATAAQLAIVPVWFGISTVRGFPDPTIAATRALSLAINLVALVVSAYATYAALDLWAHLRSGPERRSVAGRARREQDPFTVSGPNKRVV